MAWSVWPSRHGRPAVSETMTPTRPPATLLRPVASRSAEPSGSTGSNKMRSGSTLEVSTPAAAIVRPPRVRTIRSGSALRDHRTALVGDHRLTVGGVGVPVLGLADDLGRDHHDVARLQRTMIVGSGRGRDRGDQVGAGADLPDPVRGEQRDHRPGRGSALTASRTNSAVASGLLMISPVTATRQAVGLQRGSAGRVRGVHHPQVQDTVGGAGAVVAADRRRVDGHADGRQQPVRHAEHRRAAEDAREPDHRR